MPSPTTSALCLLGILVATIVLAKLTRTVTEQFDNSGALTQLSADRVTTQAQANQNMRNYRKQVRHDLRDMTGK
jgi:predicted nucleotidyltransferase